MTIYIYYVIRKEPTIVEYPWDPIPQQHSTCRLQYKYIEIKTKSQ